MLARTLLIFLLYFGSIRNLNMSLSQQQAAIVTHALQHFDGDPPYGMTRRGVWTFYRCGSQLTLLANETKRVRELWDLFGNVRGAVTFICDPDTALAPLAPFVMRGRYSDQTQIFTVQDRRALGSATKKLLASIETLPKLSRVLIALDVHR